MSNLSTTQKYWIKAIRQTPIMFGKECGFDDLGEIHNDWIRRFIVSKGDFTLQAHRGSYKTTCLSIAAAVLLVFRPYQNIILIRKSDGDVKETITQIANMLEQDIFQGMAYDLHKERLVLQQKSVFHIDTSLKKNIKGNPQLQGLGIRSSITGKHGDIIITDDIVNIEDRVSQAHRDRTKLAYMELQNIKNIGGRIINCGTPWHKDDAFQLMPNLSKADCYTTGLINDKQLQKIRGSMTASLFAANYELKHIAPEKTLFDLPIIDDGSNTELIYNGVCHIDAAYGGSDGSAFTIAKKLKDGRIFVYGLLKQKHVDDCLEEFEQKRKLFRAGTLYNETNADKGYLIRKIEGPTSSYHERQNKHIKISTYLYRNWKDIVFIKGTDPDYINQILDYTENAGHDDAPDSLASLLRVIDKDKTKINKTEMINNLKRMGL